MISVSRHGGKTGFAGPRFREPTRGELIDRNFFREFLDVPCGKCQLCRVTRRYERALRIMLEAESFPNSTYFLTLTYASEHMDSLGLDHSHWQQFMKDFRRVYCQVQFCKFPDKRKRGKVSSLTFKSIKQVMAGEYGDHFGRRHFHGIIFGHAFSDMRPTGTYSSRGNPIHTSDSLSKVWGKGFVQIEPINMDLALYVSSYITDESLDSPSGFRPQYGRFGRGIGRSYLDKYWRSTLAVGQLMLRDGSYPIPRSFFKWLEGNPDFERWKIDRRLTTSARVADNVDKGDGPLRRAKAKGRIFKHIHKSR